MINVEDFTKEQLVIKCTEQDELLRFYRKHMTDLERDLEIATAYSEMSHGIATREMYPD